MHFLYPVFLSALAVLLIPVFIHLFHFRRFKTVMFSNVKFLKAVDTERKNRNRLKHLLVLFSRCLAFICLVLAFAIPGCSDKKQVTGKSAISIFIDNSFSMDHRNNKGILLETAKQKAREIVRSQGELAEYQILSCEPSAGASVFTGSVEAIRKIDEIQVSSRSPSLGKAWKQLQDQLMSVSNEGRLGYIISDFQGSFVRDLPATKPQNPVIVNYIKLESSGKGNLSVDTAWLDNPFVMTGESANVKFRIANFSGETISDLNVRLMIDNNMRGIAKVSIPANGSIVSSVGFSMPAAVLNKAWLEIDDPENTFDNKLFFSLQPQGNLPVYSAGNNLYLNQALAANTFFKISKENPDDSKVWYQSDCISISKNEAMQMDEVLKNGGRVIIIPSPGADQGAFKELESAFGLPAIKSSKSGKFKIDRKGLDHAFFNQVFSSVPKNIEMPAITRYFSTNGSLGNGDAVLSLDNGDPFLIRIRHGKGYLYFFTSPFNPGSGNFVQSSLFLPVVVNCAFNYEQTGSIYGTTAANKGYVLKNRFNAGENNLVLTGLKGEFVPEVQNGNAGQELFLGSWLSEAGFYILKDKSNPNSQELISLNYPRTESDPAAVSEESLKEFELKTGAQNMGEEQTGVAAQANSTDSRLWRLFIWLAAAFFAVEVLLLVFWDPVSSRITGKTKPAGL